VSHLTNDTVEFLHRGTQSQLLTCMKFIAAASRPDMLQMRFARPM